MRIAVLSDIHGNLPALQAVLADLQQFDISAILVAGDLVAGPQPNEVIHLLRSLDAQVILGNNEIGLLDYHSGAAPLEWFTHKQFALGRWIFRNVDSENVAWLQTLPQQTIYRLDGATPIRVVHGSPRRTDEEIYPDHQLHILNTALASIDEPVLVCGHTHKAWVVHKNGKIALNPGSIGIPLDGDPRARYALLAWQEGLWQPILHNVNYNLDAIEIAFHQSGLLEEGGVLAQGFLHSVRTGSSTLRQFLAHAYHLAETAGYRNCKYVPDEIWDRAAETFSWF